MNEKDRKVAAMSGADDMFGKDAEFDEFERQYQQHNQDLYDLVSKFMDEKELDEDFMAQLLLDITIGMRMAAYGMNVESPSVAGLKIDLDRWRRDIDDLVREAKKGAENYIRTVKEARAAAEAEAEEEPK
jgi:hypothetical protein